MKTNVPWRRSYIPIGRGFLYLVAIMDWASPAVLAWRLTNTMDGSFAALRCRRRWRASVGRPNVGARYCKNRKPGDNAAVLLAAVGRWQCGAKARPARSATRLWT
jgi:hypothetical protein